MQQPRIRLTWFGHATVLIEIGDFRILTDPLLTSRVAHLRRRVPTVDIEPVDAILISHVHIDHLHAPSLRLVSNGARVVVPAGGESLLRRLGAASIDTVLAGDYVELIPGSDNTPTIKVKVTQAAHKTTRGPHSSIHAAPVGYVVEIDKRRIYFAGDTDLFDGMHNLGSLDMALLPISGWGPTLGEGHLDPTRATTATTWMQPRFVVPIHWGTYSPMRLRAGSPTWLTTPLETFRAELSAHDLDDRLIAVNPGGSFDLLGLTP